MKQKNPFSILSSVLLVDLHKHYKLERLSEENYKYYFEKIKCGLKTEDPKINLAKTFTENFPEVVLLKGKPEPKRVNPSEVLKHPEVVEARRKMEAGEITKEENMELIKRIKKRLEEEVRAENLRIEANW